MLFLVGNRGSGKTTVGSRLARMLNYDFVDLDQLLVEKAGRTIADVVAKDGWEEFRRLEGQVLAWAIKSLPETTVVATGGGVVLLEPNRELMRRNGQVIWLRIPPECAHARLAARPDAANRPSLTGQGLLEELREVFEAREAVYKLASSCAIDADRPCEQVCHDILRRLGSHGQS